MIIPITLSGKNDKDLMAISLDDRYDTTTIFSAAIKAFVRRENTIFCTVPNRTSLYFTNCKIDLKLYFHDGKDADVIEYLRLIPQTARDEVLKHIIRKMISKECYYNLFNFGNFFDINPPSIELESSFEQLKKNEKEGLQFLRNLNDS